MSTPRIADVHGRSRALLLAQKESLELILNGAPLSTVLRRLCETVEQENERGVVASIMILDDTGRLRNAAAPSLPEEYLAQIDGLPANAEVGTCCAAAALGTAVVTPSFETAAGWKGLAHLPMNIGFAGAWSMPIMARDGRVLGTFGTYFREVREPTGEEQAIVDVLARTAAIAIERDRAEEERTARLAELHRARDAAEAADRTKGQFLAVMSHELRTPLTGIIGYAELLGSGIDGPLSPTQVAHAGRIKSGAWNLVSMIDEILTFSRLEAGREAFDRQPTILDDVVREVTQLLAAHAASKGVIIDAHAADEPLRVEVDPQKVRQIVTNLLGNAIKFTEHGSITVSLAREAEHAIVRVRDTGIGIPAAKAEFVFEPFAQADQTHTRTRGGAGLGLAVSRGLARMMEGDVVLEESALNHGSTFALRLPMHAQ